VRFIPALRIADGLGSGSGNAAPAPQLLRRQQKVINVPQPRPGEDALPARVGVFLAQPLEQRDLCRSSARREIAVAAFGGERAVTPGVRVPEDAALAQTRAGGDDGAVAVRELARVECDELLRLE
jgi:hypothetical protein